MPHYSDDLHLGPVRKRGPLASNPTRMDTGVGPLGRVHFYDILPNAADADGVAESQSVTIATTPLATIDGALASGGIATFDVPRNVVAAWTNTAVLTVTGTDAYGRVQTESSASGTAMTGKKAFKTITAASFSANVTGATVGSGVVFGLPYRATDAAYIDRIGWAGEERDNRDFVIYDVAPITADADGVVATQNATLADGLATGINGALASGGVATFDVPRNVVAAWTGDAVLTVTGTDVFGNALTESSGSGTSMTGAKPFKTVTSVTTSANITGLTVGSGVVLGFPVPVVYAGQLVRVAWAGALADDGGTLALATAANITGTFSPSSAPNGTRRLEATIRPSGTVAVAGDTATATATTGDPRGTVTPFGAPPNGSRRLVVGMALTAIQVGPDATDAGVYGVTPA